MEIVECEKSHCQESFTYFCLNCKMFLCRRHRIEDVKEQQKKRDAEHYYTGALQYKFKGEKFYSLYCREHPNQILSGRCINCYQFACDLCPARWCTKAAGRHHDYNKIKDFVDSYKDKLSELQKKLHKKHKIFLMSLKEACHIQDKKKSELEELFNEIDRAVESQKAAVTEEGEKLKQEIVNEMSEVTNQITEQILAIEKKEAMSRQLLDDIHGIIHTFGGFLAVNNYRRLQEEVMDLIKWRIPITPSTTFSLSQGTDQKYLDVELTKTVSTLKMSEEEEEAPEDPEENKTEIIQVKSHTSDEENFWGLIFLTEDKVVTCAGHLMSEGSFTETREGETVSRQMHDWRVLQLLQYGNQLLMLINHRFNYRVRFQDTDTVLYEFTDSYYYYSPYYSHYYSLKLMAVTCDHQLMVLQRDTQTLRVVHLETKAENALSLWSVGKKVYGVLASSDRKLILLCVEEKERKQSKLQKLLGNKEDDERHSVVKYDPEIQQVVWVSDTLLTVTRTEEDRLLRDWYQWDLQMRGRLLRDWLHVAGHSDHLYILRSYLPTKVLRVSLSNDFLRRHQT